MKEELINAASEIDDLFNDKKPLNNGKCNIVCDGIIDIERYVSANCRMMWVLKEPYDLQDKEGKREVGGWDFRKIFSEKETYEDFAGNSLRMFLRLIYTSWGVLNNEGNWNRIPDFSDNPQMIDAFKSIAYINLSKYPARTTSKPKEIQIAFERDRDIVLKQIKNLKPHVVIAGNTINHFCQDLGFNHDDMYRVPGVLEHLQKDGVFYVNAYHPSYCRIDDEVYCTSIIKIIQDAHFKN